MIKVEAARAIGRLSRLTGRGGGTTLPGRMLLKFEPHALERLGCGLRGPVTVVSATNGKTTTTALLAGILESAGRRVVHNRAGSNMTWGVTTALVDQRGDEGLFEVDEAWLPKVADALSPDVFLLANLFRDQLDRHGELETLAAAWRKMIEVHSQRRPEGRGGRAGIASFVLNADDPRIADLGRDERGEELQNVIYFGIDDDSHASQSAGIGEDPANCRRCGTPYAYEARQLGHLGTYYCPECGLKRPLPEIVATKIEPRGMAGSTLSVTTPAGPLTIELPLPGLYNVYNALAALGAAFALGADLPAAALAMGASQAVFGRMERLEIEGRKATLLLIKNPTGATEVLRTLEAASQSEPGLDLWIALNDGIADGRDVSWIWDADFERLRHRVRRVTCSGRRADEMALRLLYAGWEAESITVESDLGTSFDNALNQAEGELYALPTYTALLELRSILAGRGLVADYLA